MQGIMNMEQVESLFRAEAVLLGNRDGVPSCRAEELFGALAVKHAENRKVGTGDYSNAYGIGDYSLSFLTHKGFMAAASFHNVELIRMKAGDAA